MMGPESDGLFAVRFVPDFPLEDVQEIANDLMAHGGVVPAYCPPERGVLDVLALKYGEIMGETCIVLPDLNVVSRIVRIAKGVEQFPLTKTAQFAADLMAFCQCMGLDFDPAVAFHELASSQGNTVANEDLAWFRAGDQAQALSWVAISRGRQQHFVLPALTKTGTLKLDRPLDRWLRNYVVALKIAEFELADLKPLERARSLLQWMLDDFFLAGPAAVFASMYFSPFAEKKRLIKHLRSADRERAIAGVRNAAWDMTHLSELTRRVRQEGEGPTRFIFATADDKLANVSRLMALDAEAEELESELARHMSSWWPPRELNILAAEFAQALRSVRFRPAPIGPPGVADPVAECIEAGEARLRRSH